MTDFHRSKRMRKKPSAARWARPLSGAQAETITATTHLKELRHIGIRGAVLRPEDRRLVCDRLHRDTDNETIADRLETIGGALRIRDVARRRYLAQVRQLAPEFFRTGRNDMSIGYVLLTDGRIKP